MILFWQSCSIDAFFLKVVPLKSKNYRYVLLFAINSIAEHFSFEDNNECKLRMYYKYLPWHVAGFLNYWCACLYTQHTRQGHLLNLQTSLKKPPRSGRYRQSPSSPSILSMTAVNLSISRFSTITSVQSPNRVLSRSMK